MEPRSPTHQANATITRDGAPPEETLDDPVTRYAGDVLDGRILAGPHVRAACRRHLDDLVHGPERGLIWCPDLAQRAIDYFSDELRLNGGDFEALPFFLLGWQQFCVGSIFGWQKWDGITVDGDGEPVMYRRFRTAYLEIGKGAGKSPLAAGIGLYCLMADREARAEVYAAASKKDQAMVLFRDAVAMVDQSPSLRSRLVKTGGQQCWNLAYARLGGFFRAISSDDGQSGPRPHCALVDELHEHPNGDVCDMLEAGFKFRRQPLMVKITNSGFDRETVCYRDHEYSIRVVNRTDVDDRWFAYVCALDKGDEPIGTRADPFSGRACWIKTNPSLGVTIRDDYLEDLIIKALGMPAKLSLLRRLAFCQWVGAENPWIEPELWASCERVFDWPGLPDDMPVGRRIGAAALAELAECESVVGAIDLSGKRDLTALTLAGERKDGRIITYTEFWTPLDTLGERARQDKVPYELWVEQGFVTATPGRSVDYAWVARRLAELVVLVPLSRACFDPYRIADLEPEIDATGAEIDLIAHPQGGYRTQPKVDKYGQPIPSLWMPGSIDKLADAIGAGVLDVAENPCMRQCSASAVQVATDDKGNLIFSKRKSRGRIDGIVTLAMAVGLLKSHHEDGIESLLKSPPII